MSDSPAMFICVAINQFSIQIIDLVAASGVVQFSEGSLVAVRHVSATTEEHQGTGIA